MNRQEIIKEYNSFLAKTGLRKEDFVLGAGGACVMHGIREETDDMDMDVPSGFHNVLFHKSKLPAHQLLNADGPVYVVSWNTHIDLHPATGTPELTEVDGVCCLSPYELLKQKLRLGRKKDQEDIRKLRMLLGE